LKPFNPIYQLRFVALFGQNVVAVHLAWAYVERRLVEERGPEIKCPGDLILRHREEHAETALKAAVGMALDGATLDQVLQRFLGRVPAGA
jgi:hypothetical protein